MKLRTYWLRFKHCVLPKLFGQTHHYGIFGGGKIYRDRKGYVEVGVIIGESGLYAGAPPHELRIKNVFPLEDWDNMKKVVSEMNKKRDLPVYLAKAKIRCYNVILVKSDKDKLYEANSAFAEMEDTMQKDIIAANRAFAEMEANKAFAEMEAAMQKDIIAANDEYDNFLNNLEELP